MDQVNTIKFDQNEWVFEYQLKKFSLGSWEAKEGEEHEDRKKNSMPKKKNAVYYK